jgi:ubiquinone/menaquinone biosynthesis C-methylase UbiE
MSAALNYASPAPEAIDIAWLAETIRRNRFMPTPPHDQVFVGDGDFLAVGAEFLRHCVELAGLKPDARIADIGCGIGRLAVPLTQYLDPDHGSYDGLDPVLAGIEWCQRHITPAYPRFRFHHYDVRHPLYHPGGHIAADKATLPWPDASFDFAAMISLVTHLTASEARRVIGETARILVPGGTILLTAFIIDGKAVDPRLKFERNGISPEWYADQATPMSAVAFDDGFIETSAKAHGLAVRLKRRGNWSGRKAGHYQDLFVIEKRVSER